MTKSNSQQADEADLSVPNLNSGILLASVTGLFLELLFIRWVSTEIQIFAYLQNTILVVCFLGLGLGMFTASKPIALKQSLIPMSFLLLLMSIPASRTALAGISDMLSGLGDFVIWSDFTANDLRLAAILVVLGLLLTYFLLTLVVDVFVPIGRLLGRLMNAHPNPIGAYSINIGGSLIGTWVFTLLSYFYQPPFTWFLVAAILLLIFVFWSKKDQKINLALLAFIVLFAWIASQVPNSLRTIWSPYQKLVVSAAQANEAGKYIVTVNNTGYQTILDLRSSQIVNDSMRYPASFRGISQYDLPSLFHPNPQSILIVGAGTGNDVAGALRHHVPSITAVEIDPAIISIGKELHPENPYASPNVKVINDDARSFFAITKMHYDVISFGLLDSHTTTAMTNARLDHYVYTLESLKQAKSLLNDGGVMVLSFEAQKPFIADRIRSVLIKTFNEEPLVFRVPFSGYGWGGVIFVIGDLDAIHQQLNSNKDLALFVQGFQKAYPLQFTSNTKITTDDWPYIYLESPNIPSLYYLLFGLMLFLLVRSFRKWNASTSISLKSRSFQHFFFLGAAFLLLEVQNISKASVVLGNTWEVNAVIISGILTMALLANWIAYKFPKLPVSIVYALLIGTCLGLYFIDLARFGFLPYFNKAVIVGTLTSLPMLFSGIIFTRSFALAAEKSNALGANLIGALTGAMLQSITFVLGIKALLIIVAIFYLLSAFTASSQLRPSLATSK